MEILSKMEDKSAGTSFSLTDAVSSAWRTIGQKLGIHESIVIRFKGTDEQRLCRVLEVWREESEDLADNQHEVSLFMEGVA